MEFVITKSFIAAGMTLNLDGISEFSYWSKPKIN